jgi:glutaryl-CoA dehydrogenase
MHLRTVPFAKALFAKNVYCGSQVPKFVKFEYDDCLNLKSLLTKEEIELQKLCNKIAQETMMPDIIQAYRNENFEPLKAAIREFGKHRLIGATLKDEKYNLPGITFVSYGLMQREVDRVDSGYRTSLSVQSAAVKLIYNFGSEEQKQRLIPRLASGELLGCFGITEPLTGSDPGSLKSSAVRQGDHFVLNGTKTWISNSPIADVFVVWAKDEKGDIRGFILEKGMPGLTAPKIEGKLSLRAAPTGMVVMDNVKVPAINQLPPEKNKGLKVPFASFNEARYGIAWGSIGAAEFCFHYARQYTLDRKQFGVPLASFQMIQKKYADMATEISLALLSCHQVGRLLDKNQAAAEQISIIKRNSVLKSLEIARTARDVLGGNGIADEYHVMRHVCNLESLHTYEGTADMHTLIIGNGITGIPAFRTAPAK